ncbi:MAG: GTPase Era [Erysipelotrichaceae bacterium]|jgi:GTP-binding protein Era|nr:GTPase Era [Erysipelotrichaceae bacterium]MBQ1775802.1 GTPase Era [Erysipelotrichaceae bacterium]MBQ2079621.1 GTPase Era [Erysipelotrichaceae bacterium]MBQ2505808.1 GTPase Era [Erysipelotrichaceae bacterium]MBQ3993454.1 GTPase Era [Erysipelotrichaceae bacterium]
MKSGFIAILGRPNAGKSTLINSIMKEKIAITTQKAQTTRNAILGILNDEDSQIVFIDTPGIHEAKTALGTYMNREALSQAEGVDIIYYIVDGAKGLQSEDKQILERVFSYGAPVFLLVNKIDEISSDLLIRRLTYASDNYSFAEIIPISALKKDNIDELIATSKGYLTDSVQYYPEDVKTNMNLDFRISEIIREKIILNTREEIPHLVAVRIEEIKEKTSKVQIEATIICNKDTHKGIIIGRSGSMLKKINDQASSDIARLFDGKKIILSLYVKVEEDWLNSQKQLFDLGYFSGDRDE